MTLKSVEKKYFLGDSAIFSLFWKITGNNRVFCCSAFTDEEEEGRVSLHMPLARDAVAASDASNYRHEVLTAPQAHVKVLSGLCPSFAN